MLKNVYNIIRNLEKTHNLLGKKNRVNFPQKRSYFTFLDYNWRCVDGINCFLSLSIIISWVQ